MAFKPLNIGLHKPQLHSLIDMAFILMLFFLVTTAITKMSEQENKLPLPTPKDEPGRAQILVQFIDGNKFLFIDETANAVVSAIESQFNWKPVEWRRQETLRRLQTQFVFDKEQLLAKLAALKNRAREMPEESYFLLIRCPDELPYFHVIDIIQAVSGLSNIRYGCVGGSLGDIQNAQRIYTREETDSQGVRRENFVIEFPRN